MPIEHISLKRRIIADLFGLLKWHSWLPSKRSRILMYHRVINPESEPIPQLPGMYIRPHTLKMHLNYLTKHFKIIALEDLIKNYSRGLTTKEKHIALTFDDAWIDFKTNALPILKEFNAPATLFVPTDYIDTNKLFWNDLVQYALEKIPASKSLQLLPTESLTDKIEYLKHNSNVREKLLLNISAELKNEITSLPPQFLSWSDLKEISNEPLITIGSHSHSHKIATDLSPEEFKEDVQTSLKLFEANNIPISKVFCYPNQDSTPEHDQALEKVGLKYFVSKHDRVNSFSRIGIHEDVSCSLNLLQLRLGL